MVTEYGDVDGAAACDVRAIPEDDTIEIVGGCCVGVSDTPASDKDDFIVAEGCSCVDVAADCESVVIVTYAADGDDAIVTGTVLFDAVSKLALWLLVLEACGEVVFCCGVVRALGEASVEMVVVSVNVTAGIVISWDALLLVV